MVDERPGKGASEDEIVDFVTAVLGKRAKEIDSELAQQDQKNTIADVIEQGYFGVDKNSREEEDFPEAGIELKVTPLKRKKSEPIYAPKERLSLSMLDKDEIKEKDDWRDVSRLMKHNNTLIIWYLNLEDKDKAEYPYIWFHLWKPAENKIWRDLIQRDYEIIKEKVEKDEKLSSSDTDFLEAATKDSGGKDEHNRAFAIKADGMRKLFAFSTGLRLLTPGKIRAGGVKEDELEKAIINEKKDYSFSFDNYLDTERD